METLNVLEASRLLHLNVKRVQALARAGRIPAVRIGRRWLFPRLELERFVTGSGRTLPAADGGVTPASGRALAAAPAFPEAGHAPPLAPVQLSARNRLRGRILQLNVDGLMAEVVLAVGDQELVAVITRSSAERLRLRVGDEAVAVIKATEVVIGKE